MKMHPIASIRFLLCILHNLDLGVLTRLCRYGSSLAELFKWKNFIDFFSIYALIYT